jgi:regulator of sirC expression with transglutaminase-like and TPR domain
VIRTRRGIPITLAVLWLELALGLGLHASGVGFPGHFLVKVRLPFPHEGQVVLDPFTGDSLSKEDLLERLAPMHAESGMHIDGDVSEELLAHYLRAATPREIVARMLRNLEEVYTSRQEFEWLALTKKRLEVLLPQVGDEA